MISSSGDQLTVIFDGTCDFCTAVRRRIEARDREHRITWIPCQQVATAASTPHLCEQTVVAITPDGNVDTGAQAFGRILTVLTGSPIPITIATFPVICPLLSLIYRGIALTRHHLPGITPWCDQRPEDCHPAT